MKDLFGVPCEEWLDRKTWCLGVPLGHDGAMIIVCMNAVDYQSRRDTIEWNLLNLLDSMRLQRGIYKPDDILKIAKYGGFSNGKSYGELSKIWNPNHWYECRAIADKGDFFITQSEHGSLNIGVKNGGLNHNSYLTVSIHNGYGDGETCVSIIDKDTEFNSGMFIDSGIWFEGGEIDVYACDWWNGGVARTISGRYEAYYYEGIVILKEW